MNTVDNFMAAQKNMPGPKMPVAMVAGIVNKGEQWHNPLATMARNEAFRRVRDEKYLQGLPGEQAKLAVVQAYFLTDKPLLKMSYDEWLELFDRVGLQTDEADPLKPVTLYRGATREHRAGLSWTPFYLSAAMYATHRPNSAVYSLRITEPEIIYSYGDGAEVVIDGRRFEDEIRVESAPRAKRWWDRPVVDMTPAALGGRGLRGLGSFFG